MIGEKRTKCWCPKCEKEHYQKIFWTGEGKPRLYCRGCREHVKRNGKFYRNISGHTVRTSVAAVQP